MDINKVDIDKFVQQAQIINRRLIDLYDSAGTVPFIQDVLAKAFMELGYASEIVKLAIEALYQQNEALIETRHLVEVKHQRYQDLFDFAPDGYLVTDPQGLIREANFAAATLLNIQKHYLVGKPIISFVTLEERRHFRCFLTELSKYEQKAELVVRFQKYKGDLFDAASTVGVDRDEQGKPIALRWLVRDITARKLMELGSDNNDYDFSQNRPLHKYPKGEIIPLNPLAIWYVHQGLVKLTTLCEADKEVLVGLAGAGMVFGAYLTSLQIYQATTLLDVELVSIDIAEIEADPTLSQSLLEKINHRLKQSQSFLVIASRQRIQDRLYNLLQLLKQEIGQPVPEGTRFSVRLTHKDLASACCTTRVTITRLMNKLQQQGTISFDSKKHLIMKDYI